MKTKKLVTKEVEEVDEFKCDLCDGDMYEDPEGFNSSDAKIRYDAQNSNCSCCGGNGESYDPDICAPCMKNKVIPALKELGVKHEIKEVDW